MRGAGRDRSRWLATWGRTPSTPPLDAESSPGAEATAFCDHTLRQIARVTVGGSAIRVRLSNQYGVEALLVGAAHLALRADGCRTMPGSDRALTFAGRARVSVAPGETVVSDAVALGVPALGELAVSVHLPAPTAATTVHRFGNGTSYVLDGERCGAADPAVAFTTDGCFFLTNVEVLAPADARLVVCLGDSLTDGVGSTPDGRHAWPEVLAARLSRAPRPCAVVNQGHSGNRMLRDRCGPSALARFERDVISQAGVTDVIVFEGINDIATPVLGNRDEHVSVAELVAAQRQLIARAHASGLRIYGATLTPFAGSSAHTADGETKRQAVNAFMRACGEYDGVFDFEAAVRDGRSPPALRPAYDSGDHVHLNDAGYAALAEAVELGSTS